MLLVCVISKLRISNDPRFLVELAQVVEDRLGGVDSTQKSAVVLKYALTMHQNKSLPILLLEVSTLHFLCPRMFLSTGRRYLLGCRRSSRRSREIELGHFAQVLVLLEQLKRPDIVGSVVWLLVVVGVGVRDSGKRVCVQKRGWGGAFLFWTQLPFSSAWSGSRLDHSRLHLDESRLLTTRTIIIETIIIKHVFYSLGCYTTNYKPIVSEVFCHPNRSLRASERVNIVKACVATQVYHVSMSQTNSYVNSSNSLRRVVYHRERGRGMSF